MKSVQNMRANARCGSALNQAQSQRTSTRPCIFEIASFSRFHPSMIASRMCCNSRGLFDDRPAGWVDEYNHGFQNVSNCSFCVFVKQRSVDNFLTSEVMISAFTMFVVLISEREKTLSIKVSARAKNFSLSNSE